MSLFGGSFALSHVSSSSISPYAKRYLPSRESMSKESRPGIAARVPLPRGLQLRVDVDDITRGIGLAPASR